jgi:hypothetical protein
MRARLGLLALASSIALACTAADRSSPPAPPTNASPDGGAPSPDASAPATELRVTVSGEAFARTGFDFVPGVSLAYGDVPAFVDGWAIRFEHVIVTVAGVRLSAEPDRDPSDPTRTGALVAEDSGAYAVDVVKGGDVPGKSGSPDERAVVVTTLHPPPTQARGERYAFGFDLVPASASAKRVNLDAEAAALYDAAVAKGYAAIYVGTATYRGAAPEPGSVFARMPTVVRFSLGLANATSYLNCENSDLPREGRRRQRGVPVPAGETATAQITLHTDHLFVTALHSDSAALAFDALAANASAPASGAPASVTIDDLAKVDITKVTTRAGEPLPRRSLVSDFAASGEQVRYDPGATPLPSHPSFAGYLAAAAQSAAHLNEAGACEARPLSAK